MKVRNAAVAGAISLAAAAAFSSPAYAATQHHHPTPPPPPGHHHPAPPPPPGHHHPAPPPPPRRHQNTPLAPSHPKHDGCSLSVSHPRPRPGDQETLTVQTDAGRSVVQVSYRGGRGWTLVTGRNGLAFGSFNVGNVPRHRTVTLVGEVVGAPRGYRTGATCYTSFTTR